MDNRCDLMVSLTDWIMPVLVTRCNSIFLNKILRSDVTNDIPAYHLKIEVLLFGKIQGTKRLKEMLRSSAFFITFFITLNGHCSQSNT